MRIVHRLSRRLGGSSPPWSALRTVRHRVAISTMTSNPVDGPRSAIPARPLHEGATTATCVRVTKASLRSLALKPALLHLARHPNHCFLIPRLTLPAIVAACPYHAPNNIQTFGSACTAGAHTGCQCHHRPALLAAKRLSRVPKDPLGRMFLANAQPHTIQLHKCKQSPTPRLAHRAAALNGPNPTT